MENHLQVEVRLHCFLSMAATTLLVKIFNIVSENNLSLMFQSYNTSLTTNLKRPEHDCHQVS